MGSRVDLNLICSLASLRHRHLQQVGVMECVVLLALLLALQVHGLGVGHSPMGLDQMNILEEVVLL